MVRRPRVNRQKDPELLAHLDRRVNELISGFDIHALERALENHALVDQIADELRFLGYLSDSELESATQYLHQQHLSLEAQASRRLNAS